MARIAPVPPFSAVKEHYLTAVAHGMARITGDVALMLDEFHHVAGSATEALLSRIVRYPPERVRLIVISRITPALGQERLRLMGHLAEIGAADLAFTADECRQLLTRNGLTLPGPYVGRLQARTEGWPAGLRVAVLSLKNAPNSTEVAAGLDEDRLVGRYLLAEVLDRQPWQVQQFLLRTCVVDRICGDLANTLTGHSDGDQMLSQVSAAHLFLEALNGAGQWYRWHPMFAALVRARLRAVDSKLERRLHRLAARWLRRAGFPADAARHALSGGDTEAAAAMVEQRWLGLIAAGEVTLLRNLLNSFDDGYIGSHAELAVADAFVKVNDGDLAAAQHARHAATAAAGLPPGRRLGVQVMAAAAQLHVAAMTGHDQDGARAAGLSLLAELAGGSRPLTRADRTRRALLLYNLGAFETSARLFREAAGHLRECLSESDLLNLPYLGLASRAQFVRHDLYSGRLARGRRHALTVINLAEERGWGDYHNLISAYVGLGGIEILRDEPEAAQRYLAEADRVVRDVDLVNHFYIRYLTALALRATGKVTDAGSQVPRLESLARGWDTPPAWVPVMLRTAQAEQSACEGHPAEGLHLLESAPPPETGLSVTRPSPVLHAELLTRCGRPKDALTLLAPWEEGDRPRPVLVSALVAKALAADALGEHGAALDALDGALTAAGDEDLIWPFVVPGPQAGPLVAELIDRGTAPEALAVRVLAHLAPQHTTRRSPHYLEPLTARELEVLRHLPGTQTNSQIAGQLFISLNTLRTHMKRIDRKLGTTNRRQAVHRARELGLL
jgi:LuxR family transcriptional regulator, maltose regulon positive regulatory protein